jgi:hypothetical protein
MWRVQSLPAKPPLAVRPFAHRFCVSRDARTPGKNSRPPREMSLGACGAIDQMGLAMGPAKKRRRPRFDALASDA